MTLNVRVAPRSSKDRIAGFMADGALKVNVTAPAVENRANEALVGLLARELKVPRSAIRIRRGQGSKRKLVEIAGVDAADLLLIAKE
jgi:hypothetical protein